MSAPVRDFPALLGGAGTPRGATRVADGDSDVASAASAGRSTPAAWGQYHGEHVPALETELGGFSQRSTRADVRQRYARGGGRRCGAEVGAGDEVVLAAYDYESNFLTVHAPARHPSSSTSTPTTGSSTPRTSNPRHPAHEGSDLLAPARRDRPYARVMEIARGRASAWWRTRPRPRAHAWQGKPAGTWGYVGILSFGGSKLLSAGRGGALLFRDARSCNSARRSGSSAVCNSGRRLKPVSRPRRCVPGCKLPEMTRRRGDNVNTLCGASRFRVSFPSPTPRPIPHPPITSSAFSTNPPPSDSRRDLFVAAYVRRESRSTPDSRRFTLDVPRRDFGCGTLAERECRARAVRHPAPPSSFTVTSRCEAGSGSHRENVSFQGRARGALRFR